MRNSKVGEKREMNNGQMATITEFFNKMKITVTFEDGTVVKHQTYDDFRRGRISNPKYNEKVRLEGDYVTLKNGQKAGILKYRNYSDIDIELEDGTVYKHVSYEAVKNGYVNLGELCDAYGIGIGAYMTRRKQGWTVQEALTKPVGVIGIKCKDHLGNEYDTLAQMCKKYDITVPVYRQRMQRGMSLEEALTTPLKTHRVKDHKGKEYSSIRDMCHAYGIPYANYVKRVKLGWNLEDILTTKVREHNRENNCG